jgi:radical SAM superfamily enzyme YgiQ (UPF0313 family)
MRILLISPATGNWKHIAKRKLFSGKTFRFSMLSLLTVAKLSPADAEVRIVDEQIEEIPFKDRYDLVGITCMTATAPRAFELCQYFKQRNIPVVLGGFYPSLNPDACLEHADAVVVGPAMDAWQRLCRDVMRNDLMPIYTGNPAAQVPTELPRQMIQQNQYSTPNATYATMGCKNKCQFCSISAVYKANHYTRPVADVVAEVASFDSKFFMFVDDNLTQDRDYVMDLLDRLAPLNKHWITQGTIEFADDDELLKKLAKAGCVGVFLGLETFNAQALSGTEKGFNRPDEYKRAIDKLHSHGIFVESGVIFGFPEDDVNVFESTLKMLDKIGIDAIQASILTPIPGTPLYESMKDRIFEKNLENYDYRHVVFCPSRMRVDQLQTGADWVIRKYYSPWRILKRTLRWLCTPQGRRHFIYPFVLNGAYFGRTITFKIRGENPAKKKTRNIQFPVFNVPQKAYCKSTNH